MGLGVEGVIDSMSLEDRTVKTAAISSMNSQTEALNQTGGA